MATNVAYSFANFSCILAGPGGTIQLGYGAGNSKEGVEISFIEDAGKMDIGADGTPMHSLRATKGAKAKVRLLKTSETNAALSTMLAIQRANPALWGQNVLTLSDSVRGDQYVNTSVAFVKFTDNKYAEDANMTEWDFNIGICAANLG